MDVLACAFIPKLFAPMQSVFSVRVQTQFKNTTTICILSCGLFLICRGKNGINFSCIIIYMDATFILYILGKHCTVAYLSQRVMWCRRDVVHSVPCSQSAGITSPILTSWMLTDAFTVSSQGNLPIWQFQILEPTLTLQFLSPFWCIWIHN